MVESFEQLKELQICDCKMMEIVILTEELGEKERMSEIFFPMLHYLKLKELPILTRFCFGNFLEFSSLTDFQMSKCPMLKTFISSSIIGDTENGVNADTPYLFDEKIKIPIWETLTLSSINIRQIWSSQLSSISSFAQHLTKLKVVNCCNLKYLLTFSMVKSFAQLEELMISECEIMEVVILIEGMAEEERIYRSMFPQLKTLVLNDLPQLATFCSNCDSLGEISESERVNFGIGSQELLATESTSMETKATKVVFSKVAWLALRLLPKFKYFFPQTHITEWPLLERLVVMECHEVQIVASKFSSIEMAHGDNQLERESQPLMFWISKATFPSLKHLAVKWNDNLKIWCGHHPEEYFGLEVLTLIGFPKQSAFPPPFFFESLPNLKELVVKDAFLSEIFQCEEVTAKEKPVYGHTSLSKLTLSKLNELTHLWKEESQLEADILNNLRSLKVQKCSRLKNLVPSTVHFNNLQTLVVSECHGLVNLMRYSIAKSLGQLERMKVTNCEMIEEIVVCLGDAVKDDGIVFTNLEFLQLKGLPRLESFCSGDCNFVFPTLIGAIVTECPNMQIFSKGELSAPCLHEVRLTGDIYEDMDEDIEKTIDDILNGEEGVEDGDDEVEDESCWEGNLNGTIQHLFNEKRAIMEKYECPKLNTLAAKSVSDSENDPKSKDVLPLISVDRGIELGLVGKSGSDGENEPTSENVLPAISVDRGIEQGGERQIQELSSKLNTSAGKSGSNGENDTTSEKELPPNLDRDCEQGGECQIQELGSKSDISARKSGSDAENDPTSEGGLPLSSVDGDNAQGGERQIQELSSKSDTLAGKSINENDRTPDIGFPSISVDRDIEQGEEVLKELPNEEEWQAQKSIRAIFYLSSILPESPKCPFLVALSLEGSNDLMIIPSSFFEHMPVLQRLNLSHTSITSLPISLFKLVALKTLILRHCKLFIELSPLVGELHNLEELDLDETQIMDLPKEVGKLAKLKILRLSFYGDVSCAKGLQQKEMIHPGTIKSLSHLIELSIDVNPDNERWNKAVEVVTVEACSLKSLKRLVLYLPNVEILGKQGTGETSLISYPLSKFSYIIGQHKQRIISSVPQKIKAHFQKSDKCLKFVKGEDIAVEMKSLLKMATAFYLDRHATAKSLCDFGIENMQKLEFCLLTECNEIQTIINGEDTECTNMGENDTNTCEYEGGSYSAQDPTALLNLQYLHIYYMENLMSISSGPTNDKQCLSGLKRLTLHICPKLSVIFTSALLANLRKLEVLIVEDCAEVTSLLTDHESINLAPDCFLPSLKIMMLLFLPKLESISSGHCIAPKLENICFYDCPELKSLSTRELSSENLKVIKGESEWWEALELKNEGNRFNYLDRIFFPIDEYYDVMKQMEEMQGFHESGSENLVYQHERDLNPSR